MDIAELLAVFADPETIKGLTVAQRLEAGLVTTVLGMGITFVALTVLQFLVVLLPRVNGPGEKEPAPAPAPAKPQQKASTEPVKKESTTSSAGDEELIPAITAAIAASLNTSDIVVRQVRKTAEPSSAWGQAGIIEQTQNRV